MENTTSHPDLLACIVREKERGASSSIEALRFDELPPGEVLIQVEYSSVNYKDALAYRGERGVARELPHVPGIDLAGVVAKSESSQWKPGQRVLVTGYDLGAPRWGGWSSFCRVPESWPVALPDDISTHHAMTLGTAGFTAAQCVMAISERVTPEQGKVLVTGASGGVGVWSVLLLAKLGYRVVASSGKPELAPLLQELGAAEVVGREVLDLESKRPLTSARWSAAVDTVGGAPLAAIISSLKHRGIVAACGLVAGSKLETTVIPFLLRGVTLAGIDSAQCPRGPREEIWRRLFGPWKAELPTGLVHTAPLFERPQQGSQDVASPLPGVASVVEKMLVGQAYGRTVVSLQGSEA